MRKIIQIVLLVLLFTGCSSLKQGWNNFTAYYNTFYNAKKFYNAGLEKNYNQLPDINPLQPIRVFPSPTNAGVEDFQYAIEKGSGILRNHEDSKFVIPALLIIGKSYYYRSEFFSALEKFQELNTIASGEERQEALFWLGLTYLEMSNYNQGIELLEFELENEENWIPEWEAKVQAVLGELHVAQENWEEASRYLEESLTGIENQQVKTNIHFVLGQVFERMDDPQRALFSYNQINDLRTNFDLAFNATRKQAEISRQVGSYDYAVSLYQNLRRDDKFMDYRNDLQYEIARTLQMKGDREAAIKNYNELLRNRTQIPSDITTAKTYYALGEIYRDEVKNLGMAAAYFDSAASQRVDQELFSEDFDAQELANSFGEYAEIKREISQKDSLLNLAEMDPEELESFIEELQRQELEKVEEELDRMQGQRDRMLVAGDEEPVEAAEAIEYGFLNIQNPTRLADASLQFQAVWGDRPLADNWRRRSDVSGSRFDQIREVAEESVQETNSELISTGVRPAIDTNDIPFSEERKSEVKEEIESLHYRLGNVFFLSLDMPDSARVYYKKVVDSAYDDELVTKSMYSIAEVELLQENFREAEQWFRRLEERQPNSVYVQRLAERLGIEPKEPANQESQEEFEYGPLFFETDSILHLQNRAEELVMLADNGAEEAVRPYLLFDAAKYYMQKAKNESGFDSEIRRWHERQQEIESEKREFAALQDSARTMLNDTTLAAEEQQYWQEIADSTFPEQEFSDIFSFDGAYWDSTRTVLKRIENQYSESRIMPQVQILLETLEKPGSDSVQVSNSLAEGTVQPPDNRESSEHPACPDLGVNIDVEGGMEAFMNSLEYPSWTNDVSIRGELEYLFEITSDGTIRSYEQVSRMDRSGIPQAVEEGINTTLQFTPPESGDSVTCTVLFPFNL